MQHVRRFGRAAWRLSFLFVAIATIQSLSVTAAGSWWVGQDYGSGPAAYQDAYNRAGGVSAIGYPINGVHVWGPGCIQDFVGGAYTKSALMGWDCRPEVHPVIGEHWAYLEHNYAGLASSILGYPVNDSHRWGPGWVQDFDHGSFGWNILMRGDSVGRVQDVRGEILRTYVTLGGGPGWLGFPLTDEYRWANGQRQDFQSVSLYFSPSTGAQILPTYPNGQLVQASGPTVWVMLGGRLYGIPSIDVLNCLGGWAAVRHASDVELQLAQYVYPPAGVATCSVPTREQHAADWAKAQIGATGWNGWCELFDEQAFNTRGRYPTAIADFNAVKGQGRIHGRDPNVPVGALAFFNASWQNGYFGHVMISIGSGQFVSTGPRVYVTGINEGAFGPYLGWAYADSSWPSR